MRDRRPVRGRVNLIFELQEEYFLPDEPWVRSKKTFGIPINRLRLFEKVEDRADKILSGIFPGCEGCFADIGRPAEGRFRIERFVLYVPDNVDSILEHEYFCHLEKVDKTLRFGTRIFELLEKLT